MRLPWEPELRESYEVCALRRSLLDVLNSKLNAGIQIMFQPFPVQTRWRVGIVRRRRTNESNGEVVGAIAWGESIGICHANETKNSRQMHDVYIIGGRLKGAQDDDDLTRQMGRQSNYIFRTFVKIRGLIYPFFQ